VAPTRSLQLLRISRKTGCRTSHDFAEIDVVRDVEDSDFILLPSLKSERGIRGADNEVSRGDESRDEGEEGEEVEARARSGCTPHPDKFAGDEIQFAFYRI